MMPFDPHPECRKCGGSMTTWEWALRWQRSVDDDGLELTPGADEALMVTCTRCGFAWLMATKEEKA